MTRSLAPKARTKPRRRTIPPDPKALHYFACQRCDRPICAHGVITECYGCISQAEKAFGLGPLQGVGSGS